MHFSKPEIEAGLAYCRWLHMRAFNAWMKSRMGEVGATAISGGAAICLNGVGERVYRQALALIKAEHRGGVMLAEAERKAVVKYLADLKDGRQLQAAVPRGKTAVKRAGVHLTSVRKFVGSSGARRISGIASSISTDRQGDIVVPSGGRWTLPVPLLQQHSHRDVLGKVTKAEVRGGQLWFEAEFAAEGIPRVDEVWSLVEQGALDSLSIGFRALRDPVRLPDGGLRFELWELLEISCVAVGANQDAKIRRGAKSHGSAVPLVAAGWRR